MLSPVFIDLPIATFEAPMSLEDLNEYKIQLGSAHGGLTVFQFLGMVGECKGCDKIMWIRTKDYHCCRGKGAPEGLVPVSKLLPRLDCITGGQGVTKHQYDHLFASCVKCGLVFLRTAASRHTHSN